MRTTINLPDSLILEAKKAAIKDDTTLTEIIGDALREALSRRRRSASRKQFKIITYGQGGVLPGVDLSNSAALLDIMDGVDDPDRR